MGAAVMQIGSLSHSGTGQVKADRMPAWNLDAYPQPRPPTMRQPLDRELLKEADHRIANHLALLASFVRLQAAELDRSKTPPDRESVRISFQGVIARIEVISHLHRLLAVDGLGAEVELGEYLHDLCGHLVPALSTRSKLVEDFSPGCIVGAEQLLAVAQIVAEVVTNAVKHAHQPSLPGTITVGCRKMPRGAVLIEITDDGVGFPEGFDATTGGGLGFRLVRALGRQLGASLDFVSSDAGCRFRMVTPPLRRPADLAPRYGGR